MLCLLISRTHLHQYAVPSKIGLRWLYLDIVHQKLSLLPEKPGVYLMKDAEGQVIYVGKAKVLKNRVRSYFSGSHDGKTQVLVSQIADFEYILTDSEVEALVLECNLIKRYNPKYNILLRDDKSYPYLLLTSEKHPRILVTRQLKKGDGKYFGPYPNASAAKEAARLLNRLFPLRKCRQIPNRPCLYHHLGQCLGPCVAKIEPADYDIIRKQLITFLRGGQDRIIEWLETKMREAAESLQFERAQEYRDLIADLKRLNEKQHITLNDFADRDVLGFATTTDEMCVQIFYLRQGKLLARDVFVFPYFEEAEEAFISFVSQFYAGKAGLPEEILLPAGDISILQKLFPVTAPRRGAKHELVRLASANAQTVLHDRITLELKQTDQTIEALILLGENLGINTPDLIEAFDISNTAGTQTVAGMVQFVHGKPQRSGYRKFNIQATEQTGDTAAMAQVVERRYSRLLAENSPLPDLILVDGGKGQIHAAQQSLVKIGLRLPVAGIVKDERHRTNGLIDSNGEPIFIAKQSSLFHLLERIQDEVHRFAITFHRQQRAKHMTLSKLDGIPGIGLQRRRLLLSHFRSLEAIRTADVAALRAAGLPTDAAARVYAHFHPTTVSVESEPGLPPD